MDYKDNESIKRKNSLYLKTNLNLNKENDELGENRINRTLTQDLKRTKENTEHNENLLLEYDEIPKEEIKSAELNTTEKEKLSNLSDTGIIGSNLGFDIDQMDKETMEQCNRAMVKEALGKYITLRKQILKGRNKGEITAEEREALGAVYDELKENLNNYIMIHGDSLKYGKGKLRLKRMERIKEIITMDSREFMLSESRRKMMTTMDGQNEDDTGFPTFLKAIHAADSISVRNQEYRDKRKKQETEKKLPSFKQRSGEWWKTAMLNNLDRLKAVYHVTGGLVDRALGFGTMLASNALILTGKIAKTPLKLLSMAFNALSKKAKSKKRWNVEYDFTKGWVGLEEGRRILRECAKGLAALPVGVYEGVVHGFPYLFDKMEGTASKASKKAKVFKTSGRLVKDLGARVTGVIQGLGFMKKYEIDDNSVSDEKEEQSKNIKKIEENEDEDGDDEEIEVRSIKTSVVTYHKEEKTDNEEENKDGNKETHREDNKEDHKEDDKEVHKEDNKEIHKEDNKEDHKEDNRIPDKDPEINEENIERLRLAYDNDKRQLYTKWLKQNNIEVPTNREHAERIINQNKEWKKVKKDGKIIDTFEWKKDVDEKVINYYEWLYKYFCVWDPTAVINRQGKLKAVRMENYKAEQKIEGMDKAYESQETNNCYACAGTAMLNQFIARRKGSKTVERKYTQKDLRAYKPRVRTYDKKDELIMEEAEYNKNVQNVNLYSGKGKTAAGNIFALGDFMFEKLEKEGIKDAVLNRMVIKAPMDEVDAPKKIKERNKVKLGNMQAAFATKINEIVGSGGIAGVCYQTEGFTHYITISAINGSKVKIYDSAGYGGKPKERDISDLVNMDTTIEINWLSDMKKPEELTKEYKRLQYDKKNGFSASFVSHNQFSESITHTKGITILKDDTEFEKEYEDIAQMSYIPDTQKKINSVTLDAYIKSISKSEKKTVIRKKTDEKPVKYTEKDFGEWSVIEVEREKPKKKNDEWTEIEVEREKPKKKDDEWTEIEVEVEKSGKKEKNKENKENKQLSAKEIAKQKKKQEKAARKKELEKKAAEKKEAERKAAEKKEAEKMAGRKKEEERKAAEKKEAELMKKPLNNYDISPAAAKKLKKEFNFYKSMKLGKSKNVYREGTDEIQAHAPSVQVTNVEEKPFTISGLAINRLAINLRGPAGEGRSNEEIISILERLNAKKNMEDNKLTREEANKQFDAAMYELKNIYYTHLKRLENTYGRKLSQMHPHDILRIVGDDFAKVAADFDLVQDVVQMLGSGRYFDLNNNKKDKEFFNLSHYYYVIFTNTLSAHGLYYAQYEELGKEAPPYDEKLRSTASRINEEGVKEHYNITDKDIGGASLSKKEQQAYIKDVRKRARAEGWDDKLYGRFADPKVKPINREVIDLGLPASLEKAYENLQQQFEGVDMPKEEMEKMRKVTKSSYEFKKSIAYSLPKNTYDIFVRHGENGNLKEKLKGMDYKRMLALMRPVKVNADGHPINEDEQRKLDLNNNDIAYLIKGDQEKRFEFLNSVAEQAHELFFTVDQLQNPAYILKHRDRAIRHLAFMHNAKALYEAYEDDYVALPNQKNLEFMFNLMVATDYVEYSSLCIQHALFGNGMELSYTGEVPATPYTVQFKKGESYKYQSVKDQNEVLSRLPVTGAAAAVSMINEAVKKGENPYKKGEAKKKVSDAKKTRLLLTEDNKVKKLVYAKEFNIKLEKRQLFENKKKAENKKKKEIVIKQDEEIELMRRFLDPYKKKVSKELSQKVNKYITDYNAAKQIAVEEDFIKSIGQNFIGNMNNENEDNKENENNQ